LKEVKDYPKRLYYKGEWNESYFDNCLAVVGTRSATPYGEKVVKHLLSGLDKRITVVSGFMTGIDRFAHIYALENGLRTIGVLPCGIELVFPPSNIDIYNSILEKFGLIISEYPDFMPPRKWTFLTRNRLVVGLSSFVLVVEASLNSGSLRSASIATKLGRQLGAVPGNIFNRFSQGTHKIITEDGVLVSDSYIINNFFGFDQVNYSDSFVDCSGGKDFERVLSFLRSGEMSFEELLLATGMPSNSMNTIVTQLELSNKIFERNGKFYVS
jgi:DNA processing protein